MLQTIKKSYKVLALASMFLLVGCGGGGVPESVKLPSKPDSSQMAKIDDDNANIAVLSTYQSIDQPEDLDSVPMGRTISSNRLILKSTKLLNYSAKKYDASSQCDSGSATVDEKSETSVSIEYNNCVIDNFILNGKVKYSEDEYGSREIEFNNYTAKNKSLDIYFDIKHMLYHVNGETDGETIKDVYATYKIGKQVLKYFNYNSQKEGGVFKFNGYIKPICLNGYVYIESKDKLENTTLYDDEDKKPAIKGTFIVKSDSNTVQVDIDKDLVYVTLPNKKVETYSYDDIVKAMKTPSCHISIKETLPYRPKSDDFIKLTNDNSANTKVSSAIYKASNLNINKNFPQLKELLRDLDSGLSCISGDVNEEDNSDKIDASYKNCEISSGVIYDGNISFKVEDGNVSEMLLNNLSIKQNNSSTNIKYAKVYETFKDNSNGGVDSYFHIENMHANINNTNYLDFNFTNVTNNTENNEINDKIFSGYIKTPCLGKYAYADTTLMIYDLNDNIVLGDFKVSDTYIDNSDEVDDDLFVSIDANENSVEITLEAEPQPFTITVDEFLNKCK